MWMSTASPSTCFMWQLVATLNSHGRRVEATPHTTNAGRASHSALRLCACTHLLLGGTADHQDEPRRCSAGHLATMGTSIVVGLHLLFAGIASTTGDLPEDKVTYYHNALISSWQHFFPFDWHRSQRRSTGRLSLWLDSRVDCGAASSSAPMRSCSPRFHPTACLDMCSSSFYTTVAALAGWLAFLGICPLAIASTRFEDIELRTAMPKGQAPPRAMGPRPTPESRRVAA